MMFIETDLSQISNSSRSWTQEVCEVLQIKLYQIEIEFTEAVNMAAPCWKLLWGWYVSGFKLMEESGMSKN